MPIYEFYCPDNHTIYQFYAKTLAQGKLTPKCPANPAFTMKKLVSAFAVTSGGRKDEPAEMKTMPAPGEPADDARMDAAMGEMEREFSGVDENDPKAMARMMRRMSELTGERIDGEMEKVVRKLEEGADPDSLEEDPGGEAPCHMPDPCEGEGNESACATKNPKEQRHRFKARVLPPRRDPQLHDYE